MAAMQCMRPMALRLTSRLPIIITRAYSGRPATIYEFIKTSEPRPSIGQITLHRPSALNALSTPLIHELNTALRAYDSAPLIRTILLTGSPKAFAAGADIKEMSNLTFASAYTSSFLSSWSEITSVGKPIIGCVSGYALGGGCELALMCDILYCTQDAKFGQPEIKLGVIPGVGGSQRLTKAVGKARAMELILTGKNFSAEEADRWGVVSRVFGSWEEMMEGAVGTAETIGGYSLVATQAAKEVVNKSQDLGIKEGMDYERRVFYGLFGTKDQKIGMKAFVEKKKAEWVDE